MGAGAVVVAVAVAVAVAVVGELSARGVGGCRVWSATPSHCSFPPTVCVVHCSMKGGAKVIIEPHRHPGVFVARGKEDALVTLNMVPGKTVYGEKTVKVDVRGEDSWCACISAPIHPFDVCGLFVLLRMLRARRSSTVSGTPSVRSWPLPSLVVWRTSGWDPAARCCTWVPRLVPPSPTSLISSARYVACEFGSGWVAGCCCFSFPWRVCGRGSLTKLVVFACFYYCPPDRRRVRGRVFTSVWS